MDSAKTDLASAFSRFKEKDRRRSELVAKARIMAEFNQSWKDVEDMELPMFVGLMGFIAEQDKQMKKQQKKK